MSNLFLSPWLAVCLSVLGTNPSPFIISTTPARHSVTAPRGGDLALTFSTNISGGTASKIRVFGGQAGGRKLGPFSTVGKTVSFNPDNDFRPGELVNVTVPATVQSAPGGFPAIPYVYQFTAAATGGTGNFSPAPDVSVGNSPSGVVAADVDSDGDLDIITANEHTDDVSVRLNNGSGSFSGVASIGVGNHPSTLLAADVDGDGDLDLVVANADANSLSVRLNNGSGTFSGGSTIGVGGYPLALSAGDLDGDGDLDLLAANRDDNNVSVRFNDGDGTFSGIGSVGIGSFPQGMTTADVDNDGDLDLIAANELSNNISIRLNNGSGSFSGATALAVATHPVGVDAGDIDGDGDVDIVVSSIAAPTQDVSVLRNNGSGTFTVVATLDLANTANKIELGDVDGDGDLDFMTKSTLERVDSCRVIEANT